MNTHITTTDGRPPAPGLEHGKAAAPQPIDPATGQHRAYWVLSEEERAKGFVRPVRRTYVHVGPAGPEFALRDLTVEEQGRYGEYGYVKAEDYPPERSPITGRFWTQAQLDAAGKVCGGETVMGVALAETYARQPSFYSSTFCVGCKKHLPVTEFRWDDGSVVGS